MGVGDADFSAMDELDADFAPLHSRGKIAERDIVQFVPFNKFFTRSNDPVAKELLAKEVLAEVPRQIITYMATNKFEPKLRRSDTGDLFPHFEASESKSDFASTSELPKGTSDLPSTSESELPKSKSDLPSSSEISKGKSNL